METLNFLQPGDVLIGLAVDDKPRLLYELAVRAAARGGLDAEDVLAAVTQREALGSTGVGRGIAMPHARLSALTRPTGAAATLRRPIDFDAIDGAPVDLALLLLLPAGGTPINVLAACARQLRDEVVAVRARAARTPADFVAALRG